MKSAWILAVALHLTNIHHVASLIVPNQKLLKRKNDVPSYLLEKIRRLAELCASVTDVGTETSDIQDDDENERHARFAGVGR